MKLLVHLCVVFLLALASCTRAAEPSVAAKDAAKRKKAIAAEIQRRQAIIKAAKAGLAREFVKKRKAQDHKLIKDLLGLLKEFRAIEAADLLCKNIDYYDPDHPPWGGSLRPTEESCLAMGVLTAIGLPAKSSIIKHLKKASSPPQRRLLVYVLIDIVGVEATWKEIDKGSLKDVKDIKRLVRPLRFPEKYGPKPKEGKREKKAENAAGKWERTTGDVKEKDENDIGKDHITVGTEP